METLDLFNTRTRNQRLQLEAACHGSTWFRAALHVCSIG